ncbi:MAG TPA: glutaminyl-peptide cyclotransferase, partial [Allosphingosinicella sp.]|nr:glutaminyl-peptide cyclotransferase [Allosphingosinicella sp.]
MLQALFAILLAVAVQPPAAPAPAAPEPPVYDYRIVATYPHDREAYTQGLVYLDGQMLESTGRTGTSWIRHVRFEDGHVLRQIAIPPEQFGEGIVNWGNQIVSITWTSGTGYRWDLHSLRRLGEWHYQGEGWGLTQNGTDIIMSDGTNELRFLDPATLAERRRIAVTINGRPVANLNELEWVHGEVFANVWMSPYIVRIDPASGNVTGVIDLTPLVAENRSDEDGVLNGIAYDAARDRLFVTGKLWP